VGPYIRLIEEAEASGPLRDEYDAAVGRAGRVFWILKAMSHRPAVLRAFLELNREVMLEPCGLSESERELLAIVVSRTNRCSYSLHAHEDLLAALGGPPAERDGRQQALERFAVKLTERPAAVGAEDVDLLRGHGLDDAAIHDAIQTIAFFNYANRIASATGIPDEPPS
jgi:uncharacterized peroxidase-related enzyme